MRIQGARKTLTDTMNDPLFLADLEEVAGDFKHVEAGVQ
jgi:hypothetical protein